MDFDAALLIAAVSSPVWGVAAGWLAQRLTRRGRLERLLLRDADVIAAMPDGAAKRAVQGINEKNARQYASTRLAPVHFYEPIHLFVGLQMAFVFVLWGLLAMIPATAEWARTLFDGFPNMSGEEATEVQQDNLWATAFLGGGVTMGITCWFFMRVERVGTNAAALAAIDAEYEAEAKVEVAELATPEPPERQPRWWERVRGRG